MAEVNDNINRPSIKGPYRPIRNGTIQGSISALVTSAIATGILNLPVRVHQLGVIPFTIVMTLIVALSYYGMVIMEWIIVKHKVQSYAEMVNRAFGRKKMLFSEYLLIFLTWGGVVCTEVVFIRFANQLLNDVIGLPLY
jgi:amino acid permease